MDFIAMYNIWISAQQKVGTLPNSTVSVNQQDQLIEFKIGQNLVLASADLQEIHVALDAAIIIDGIVNP